jgi:homoserine O-acetyltransferase
MDVMVPLASLPTEMSGRNWMTRRLLLDAIRNDPGVDERQLYHAATQLAVHLGDLRYCHQCGHQALYKAAPTREKADEWLNQRLSAPFHGDANDHLYQ